MRWEARSEGGMHPTWVSAGSLWLPEGPKGAGVGPGRLRRSTLRLHVKTEGKFVVDRGYGVEESWGVTTHGYRFLRGAMKMF